MKILIVDDETMNRRLIRKVLTKAFPDAQIDEAADGIEAMSKIRSDGLSALVLDLQLPGVDGFKICQLVRADPALRHIKILVISGDDVEESGKRALASGADDFLSKPFEIAPLTQKLEALLAFNHEKPR